MTESVTIEMPFLPIVTDSVVNDSVPNGSLVLLRSALRFGKQFLAVFLFIAARRRLALGRHAGYRIGNSSAVAGAAVTIGGADRPFHLDGVPAARADVRAHALCGAAFLGVEAG